jgi:hypothetical protein
VPCLFVVTEASYFFVLISEEDLLLPSSFRRPQQPGCPILRSLIAKGGDVRLQPVSRFAFTLALALALTVADPTGQVEILAAPGRRYIDKDSAQHKGEVNGTPFQNRG